MKTLDDLKSRAGFRACLSDSLYESIYMLLEESILEKLFRDIKFNVAVETLEGIVDEYGQAF